MRWNKGLIQATLIFFIAFALLTSCSKNIPPQHLDTSGIFKSAEAGQDTLNIRFIGVACFLFEYQGNYLLTDPFISNPPMKQALFGKIEANPEEIDKYVSKTEQQNLDMMLAGHSHYDHVMAIPYLIKQTPASTVICGNRTLQHMLAPEKPMQQVVALNDLAGDSLNMGQWIYTADSSIRTMAFKSDHPAHFMGITMYYGPVCEDLAETPDKTKEWKCGQPLSYIIDFIDSADASIAYRIFFQSSGSTPPLGFFPESLKQQHAIDVSIYSIATKFNTDVYPYQITQYTDPSVCFLAHWENFFLPKEEPYKSVQKGKPVEFKKALQKSFPETHMVLPKPGAEFQIH